MLIVPTVAIEENVLIVPTVAIEENVLVVPTVAIEENKKTTCVFSTLML